MEAISKPSKASLNSLILWARVPELPIDFYDKEILKQIGNRYARICVEIDLSKPLLPQIRVGKSIQRIEYEGIHNLCFNCGMITHKKESCPLIKPNQCDSSEKNGNMGNTDSANVTTTKVSDDYGPWMVVENRKSRRRNPIHGKEITKTSYPENHRINENHRSNSESARHMGLNQVQVTPQPLNLFSIDSTRLLVETWIVEDLLKDAIEKEKAPWGPEFQRLVRHQWPILVRIRNAINQMEDFYSRVQARMRMVGEEAHVEEEEPPVQRKEIKSMIDQINLPRDKWVTLAQVVRSHASQAPPGTGCALKVWPADCVLEQILPPTIKTPALVRGPSGLMRFEMEILTD